MRLKRRNKTGLFFAGLFSIMSVASAQSNFKYAASIHKVDSSGFYKIGLQPQFIAKSNADLSDIRLIDQKGRFVPYVTADNLPQPENEKFIVFPQVFVALKNDTGTSFIIESKEKLPVNMLWIKLKNAAVKRTINLYGSDNLKRWFAIREDIPLEQAGPNNDGAYQQSLSFPASNYHYFKLLVNDKNKAPLNFLEAGIYAGQSVANLYFTIPAVQITTRNLKKTTIVTLKLNDNYLVNELNFEITAPKYYKRNVAIYQIDKQNRSLVSDAELTSGKSSALLFTSKTNTLELEIDNGDNLPLALKNIEVLQADQFIVSYLEAGQVYKLLTGDLKAIPPEYDLKFFTDSVRKHILEISHDKVEKNERYHIGTLAVKREYTLEIWAAIIVALLLLSILTLKMAKEVNKTK